MSVVLDIGPQLYIILVLGLFAYIIYIALDFVRAAMIIHNEVEEKRQETHRREESTV